MFKFIFFTFLIFTFVPLTNAQQSCSSDQQNAIKTCYLQYLKIFGFNVIPIFNQYEAAVDKYYVHGWNGALYVCNAGNQLISCIGAANDGCVTVDVFRNISGLNDINSKQYVADYRETQYRCSGNGFTGNFF
uniref:Transmembrane protein n=1 Tax=Panagrolaimus sp. ES5 TaxID=591445 RepID=A0AC34FFZ7_9BILA